MAANASSAVGRVARDDCGDGVGSLDQGAGSAVGAHLALPEVTVDGALTVNGALARLGRDEVVRFQVALGDRNVDVIGGEVADPPQVADRWCTVQVRLAGAYPCNPVARHSFGRLAGARIGYGDSVRALASTGCGSTTCTG